MLSLRALVSAAAFAVCVAVTQIQPVAAAQLEAAVVQTEAAAVENFAEAQLSKPFHLGATGMHSFDCSGLVYRTYFETGLIKKISGRQRRARGYYAWFKDHGLITHNPRPGDLVVWAHRHRPVSHIGIFIGYNKRGQAMAISALINPYGVSRHRVNGIHIPFKAYLRVDLGQ